ncbi:hypothetical protein FRC0129_02070 [Corynebacterium diphtheriae]|nr:hypothetical protein CIP107549_02054 [Corynebacterium diphtheriae]CAB0760977.1 hypothetical protein FRC0129_02070 [Corynebacterium diphtheriae]
MKENSWRVSRQIMPKKDSFLVFSGADSASFTSLFTTLRLATLPLTVASAAATDGNHLNAIDLT